MNNEQLPINKSLRPRRFYVPTDDGFCGNRPFAMSAMLGEEQIPGRPLGPTLTLQRGHQEYVLSLALSKDGKWLVTIGQGGQAVLWETATGREVARLPGTSRHGQCCGLFRRRQTTRNLQRRRLAENRYVCGESRICGCHRTPLGHGYRPANPRLQRT